MAITGAQFADAYAILKEYIGSQELQNLIYSKFKLWSMIKKNPNVAGKYVPFPLTISGSVGISGDFPTAQANASNATSRAFQVPMVSIYNDVQIPNVTIQASRNDAGAFERDLKLEVESAMRELTKVFSAYLFRSGTGSLGSIGSISTGVIQLSSLLDGVAFADNMVFTATSADGSGTTRAGVGYVVGVNRSLGQVTVSVTKGGSAGTPSGWQAGDFLVLQGTANAVFSGIGAYVPATNRPVIGGSTAQNVLWGVDRAIDPDLLAGVLYQGTSQPVDEALSDGVVQIANIGGGSPDVIVTNWASFQALNKSLGARREYVDVDAGNVGFRTLGINGPDGLIPVISDRNAPAKLAYALELDSWEFMSYGQAPGFLPYPDGFEGFRMANADAVETRLGGYANLACNAPGHNGVITLAQ